jgi:hypothetical protein
MSIQHHCIPPVPPDTEAVARAAFPKGNIYVLLSGGDKCPKTKTNKGVEGFRQAGKIQSLTAFTNSTEQSASPYTTFFEID